MYPSLSDDEHPGSQPRHGVGYSVWLLDAPHLSWACVVTKKVCLCNPSSFPFLATRHLQVGRGRGCTFWDPHSADLDTHLPSSSYARGPTPWQGILPVRVAGNSGTSIRHSSRGRFLVVCGPLANGLSQDQLRIGPLCQSYTCGRQFPAYFLGS